MTPEQRIKFAIQEELDKALLQLDCRRLDLIDPAGAPHNTAEVREFQRAEARERQWRAMQSIARGVKEAFYSIRKLLMGISSESKDDYILAPGIPINESKGSHE